MGGKTSLAVRLISAVAIAALSFAGSPSVGQCAQTKALRVYPEKGRIEIDGKVARQDVYYEQLRGVLEYVATCEGGKVYESLFVLQPKPTEIFEAFQKLGLERGKPAYDDESGKHHLPEGQPITIWVRWKENGKEHLRRVEDFVRDEKTTETMPHCQWTYIGSEIVEDPATGKKVPQVAVSKNIVSLHHEDQWVLIQNPLAMATDQTKRHANKALLPKDGTSVTLIFQLPKVPEGMVRIHAFLSGRVQGVGFRNFTRMTARRLGVKGWVKNLPDGRVEIVAEGDQKAIEQFKKRIRRGPRAARVAKVEIKPEKPKGLFRTFEIRY